MTEDQMNKIANHINNKEGQRYPCSNQNVVCGFFGHRYDWNSFCDSNDSVIRGNDFIKLSNGDYWRYFSCEDEFKARGYRFYKLKVDKGIANDIFRHIQIYCSVYCKEIEWI
jgi:hypothetical protein